MTPNEDELELERSGITVGIFVVGHLYRRLVRWNTVSLVSANDYDREARNARSFFYTRSHKARLFLKSIQPIRILRMRRCT